MASELLKVALKPTCSNSETKLIEYSLALSSTLELKKVNDI